MLIRGMGQGADQFDRAGAVKAARRDSGAYGILKIEFTL